IILDLLGTFQMSWPFEDADSFHPASNISKMQQGIPLSDEDRLPWLLSLNKVVENLKKQMEKWFTVWGFNLLCTKDIIQNIIFEGKNYQDQSESHREDSLSYAQDHLIVLLEGSKQLIQERMSTRQGHFMPSTLLDSQIDILQPLHLSPFSLNISIDKTVEDILNEIVERIEAIL
ncbi:hypothetical protein QZH41_018063, partial [Actinostola sp. cb2023]